MRGVLIALAVITTATVRLACMHDSAIVLTLMMLIDADVVWPSVASKHPMHACRAQNWLKHRREALLQTRTQLQCICGQAQSDPISCMHESMHALVSV
jgi:hypothetical protein